MASGPGSFGLKTLGTETKAESKTKKTTKIKIKIKKKTSVMSQKSYWPPAIELCQDAWARFPVVVVLI